MGICKACGARLDHLLAYEPRIAIFVVVLDESGNLKFDPFSEETSAWQSTRYGCPICDTLLELENEAEVKVFLRE